MTTPYTYLIGWSRHDLWYYGVRWAKGCSPDDLWRTYFTSSNRVAAKRVELGEPDVVEVRKVFETSQKARGWEEKVIKRMGAVRSPRWLNLGNGGKNFLIPYPFKESHIQKMTEARRARVYHAPHTEKAKAKMRAAKVGIPRSEETKAKLRKANLGKPVNYDALAKAKAANTGSKRSEETKAKMRAAWEKRRAEAKPLTQEERMAKAACLIEYRKAHLINNGNGV